ncbi:unnamed protein product [Rotaria magnacalcarata]|uniref:NAD(P)(+)--arginine ADP-ribosyltransferase n=1 Tax=Rotaria magnacalcarata TaxID=392030 RepID=A0A820C3U3_9BILA|nr:unnamed protein product [Rotaria magnacalcarata]CAF4216108.1 unnamed protein product [Rotaria magnacalcarata]
MLKKRIQDVLYESNSALLPIEGFQNERLVSLEEAIVPLFTIFDRKILQRNVLIAKERCESPADGLSLDESTSITLYTFEWNTNESSFYFILNQTLRMEDRQKLKPWFLYLKLFITTLSRLPPIAATVYRGIKVDLTNQYKPNSYSIWWGVSSCTDNIEILQSEQFCGKTGMRTIFVIKCLNGRSIRNHSYYPQENEIILMPGSYFQVDGCYDPSDEFHIVQLREIKPPYDSVPRTNTNQWRQTTLGICLEGICTNTDCIAYQREVIIPIGFRKFNVLTDATASISKCSLCSAYSKVSKIGFSHCQWRYRGIKQRLSGEQPISCMDEWCDIGEYSIFKHEPQETYA